MKIDAILCNHAETANNLLYLAGGGINVTYAPPSAKPPFQVSLGIGLVVTVPPDRSDDEYTLELRLLAADDQPVLLPIRDDELSPLVALLHFRAMRKKDLPDGDDLTVALAMNFVSLPLPAFGRYEFVFSFEGKEVRRLPLRMQEAPTPQPD